MNKQQRHQTRQLIADTKLFHSSKRYDISALSFPERYGIPYSAFI